MEQQKTSEYITSINSHEQHLIETELLSGSGFEDGKDRIYEFALTNPTGLAFAQFLKNEYGTGGHSGVIRGMEFVDHDSKGIRFDWVDDNEQTHNVNLTWVQVADYIVKLVDEGRYHNSQQLKPKVEQLQMFDNQPLKTASKSKPQIINMSEKLLPIYNQCLNDVKSNWLNYLNCVVNVHNHNVTNQVMIFGQSKNSQLVADEKTWNKLGRYVNFNAMYITTIIKKSNVLTEQKLYDISKTYGEEVDIDTQRFIVDVKETTALNASLSSKYRIQSDSLKGTIQTLVAGIYKVNPVKQSMKKYERLIKNSVYYVVCKKLSILPPIDYTSKFREVQSASIEDISLIGKSINATTQKLLNEIENNLKIVRSNNNERESNNGQRRVHSRGRGLVQERGEQYTLQTGIERDKWNTDISTSNRDSTRGGQLSFTTVRQTTDEIHGREPRGQVLGVDNSRTFDEETSRERGTTQGYENIIDGTNREEKPKTDNGRFLQDSATHGVDTNSSGGNGERGTIQANLKGVKVGEFIELYGADAEITARELNLTLTHKLVNNVDVSMVGFPIKNLQIYSQILSDKEFYLQTNLADKLNYRYDSTVINNDSAISYGGAKFKYNVNIEAIKLLKQIESEDRLATAEEQYTLARYTGFGGISQAFDSNAKGWENEYKELYELLTPAEYGKARESTLTAYYTEPMIIKAMYQGLLNLGVDGKSKILEPSMGVGNFFGMLPNELQQCELHGVELDDLTGRLAKQLYQTADIQIKGYQDTMYQDNLFDCSIGNVPFGDFKVSDDKHSFLVHDYFFAKTLDKVKPNGVIAFISSKGTLDKANSTFRKYMAERAELIGAVRLPNTAFKAIAGTEATTDVIFLRKREKQIVCEPEWVHVGLTENNVPVNQYYIDNPQNLLGEMVYESSQFGQSAVLKPFDNFDLYSELENRIVSFAKDAGVKKTKTITPTAKAKDQAEAVIPADPNVKNFTYTVIDNNVYYRENETMSLVDLSSNLCERIKGMDNIRKTVRSIIFVQMHNQIEKLEGFQALLNDQYDAFVKKYGNINSKLNKKAFEEDSDYPLLSSIENVDSKGIVAKSKMFTQATIKPKINFIPKTYEDLITLSMSRLGEIDIEFMAEQFNVTVLDVIENLKGKIYLNPQKFANLYNRQQINNTREYNDTDTRDMSLKSYETTDKYLSGNVKEKLDFAREKAIENPELYEENVLALEKVQPTPLTADEIDMKLGSSFIDIKYYKQFMYDLAETPRYQRQTNETSQRKDEVTLTYNSYNSEYTIYNKSLHSSVKTNSAYGTDRKSFYSIIEDSLNLKDTKVYDRKMVDDKEKPVLNIKETQLARQKQVLIHSMFKDWLLSDIHRANDVIKTYNERFNVYRPQVFNGADLFLEGMSNEIELRPHQKDSVARCLYSGNNVLLGHVVGAGKTYTMASAAMELKRIGIANKPLFVVPNHLTEQWGSDFLKLYPNANILVAKKKDFEPLHRKRFIGRICTGEYDAVIIGHTQFERIPMSKEYIKAEMENQINEITCAISRMKEDEGSKRYSIKQMESQKAKLDDKLKNLDKKKKDDVITFEETGIDQIFVDEAHNYKNCFVHTKMTNVAGVTTSNAQKSFDMLMKTKYIADKNDGKGVIFATGTPISNSMTEMFVMQRYLQPDALIKSRVSYFDEWASTFGETQTALELKPEGTGYRLKTRFAKFHNLPELINMFAQVADIKVAEDLNLPIPKLVTGKPIIEVSPASEFVKAHIDTLATRAEKIREGLVDAWEDNMLKITGEGKAVAIDARLIDPKAVVDRTSKVYKCCDNVVKLYNKCADDKALQLIFLDSGLSLYPIIKEDLVSQGVNPDEVAFIHEAKTDEQKAQLFAKCRSGDIRVLIGSTQKMGAGTNVQERLVANHHLDCPWRPADIEQRDGRILRQGNMYDEVYVYRYITENTFDSYLWQIQENKQKFITQIMTNKSAVRSCDDIDSAVLDCAEIKTLATGDPRIKQKMQLDNDIYVLQIEKSAYQKEHIKLQNIAIETPKQIDLVTKRIDMIKSDMQRLSSNKGEDFKITIGGAFYDERTKAGEAFNKLHNSNVDKVGTVIGNYCGFDLVIVKPSFCETAQIILKGEIEHRVDLGLSALGNITRLENICDSLPYMLKSSQHQLAELEHKQVDALIELKKPFTKDDELKEKLQKQVALNSEMELGKPSDIVMKEDDENEISNQVSTHDEEENEM